MAGLARVVALGAGTPNIQLTYTDQSGNAISGLSGYSANVAISAAALNGISVPSKDLNSDLHASAEYRAHLITVMAKMSP